MSVVLTSDGVQRLVLNLASYIQQFWAFLGDKQIKPALMLPDWIADSEQKIEREKMFFEWIGETRRKSPIFTRRWKYHFFEVDGRSQMMDDWLPPISYAAEGVPGYALPQTPQTRRKISDPFDPHGRKRSIRVHLKGKLPTR